MCGIVLLLRRIKRIPRFFVYLLWAVPLFRLWMPFGISGKFSLMTLIAKITTRTVIAYEPEGLPPVAAANFVQAANEYFPIVYKTNVLASVFQVAALIWIIVTCAALIAMLALYFFTRSEMKDAVPIRGNLYMSSRITAPAVYGIIRAKIIVPEGTGDEDLKYIALHENAHIHRKDNLFRCIALITACIHWFNPLVWICLKYCFEDMELACDAKVLKSLHNQEQKEYALSLLSFAAGKNRFVSAFGGAKIKVRIENILSYKKLTFVSALCFTLFVIAVAAALLTNAQIA
jgi:beta-lactamase regulating signal transducer with metallopeptidase domain